MSWEIQPNGGGHGWGCQDHDDSFRRCIRGQNIRRGYRSALADGWHPDSGGRIRRRTRNMDRPREAIDRGQGKRDVSGATEGHGYIAGGNREARGSGERLRTAGTKTECEKRYQAGQRCISFHNRTSVTAWGAGCPNPSRP